VDTEILKDRIRRMRSGGLDGPSPSGFLLSIADNGNVMIVTHDLGIAEGSDVAVSVGDGFVRLSIVGKIMLQATDTDPDTRVALVEAPSIVVLEMEGSVPVRLHPAHLA
jgi:hypothetical protein